MTAVSSSAPTSSLAAGVDRFIQWLLRHWLLFVGLALGIWTLLPWLAPVLMRLGWYQPAWWIYFIYSLFCHQLPQRSWFLFGPQFTPSLAEIQRRAARALISSPCVISSARRNWAGSSPGATAW